jgi:hypothetical protein
MITLTVPSGDADYDQRHGVATWRETLTDAPYVWNKAGAPLSEFEGARSEDCAVIVRDAINRILMDPPPFIAVSGYYTLMNVTASLTRLFFLLRQRPDGIVHVE